MLQIVYNNNITSSFQYSKWKLLKTYCGENQVLHVVYMSICIQAILRYQ